MGLEVRYCTRGDGVRLAYAVLGCGPPLVWIPGWINHLELMWARDTYRSFFQRLARHRTVVLYDKHGIGLSDRDRTDFTLDADLADLRTILDELAIVRATLLGNSQAGAVAAAFAVEDPDRIDRLILHGAWAHIGETSEGSQEAFKAMIRVNWGLATELFTDLFVPEADAEDRAWFARLQRECADAATALGLLELCYEQDVRGLLGQVRAPTLVLHREGDRIAHRSLGRELAARIPDARFVRLPGRAHFPWEGDVEPVLQAIETFLGIAAARSSMDEPAVDEAAQDHAVLRREGDVWVVGRGGGRRSLLKDVKGLRYLAELLGRPGREAHALELVAAVEGTPVSARADGVELTPQWGPDAGLGPVLDGEARTRYRHHLEQLRREHAEAQHVRDLDRAAALKAEMDAIGEEISRAVGLGGRNREAANSTERARVKVTRLLRDAVRRIEQVDPQLGHLLDVSVRTGTYCAYEPPPDGGPRWEL